MPARAGILVMGANRSNPTRLQCGRAECPVWHRIPGAPDKKPHTMKGGARLWVGSSCSGTAGRVR